MIDEHHILDVNLPLNQNFFELKNQGLSFIQQFGSSMWTNLNQSDPGVTILDQLCFALTELGYCGDFSIEDILTDADGKIDFENQFFLPYDILTTAPILINDYIKLIVDNIPRVVNAVLIPAPAAGGHGHTYETLLYLDPTLSAEVKEGICIEVFVLLNDNRNLNEFFNLPVVFKPVPFMLQGGIFIDSIDDLQKIIIDMQKELNEFIFPSVVQSGYDVLSKECVSTNEIFNGPKMENGWIAPDQLKKKKSSVNHLEIGHLISTLKGVASATGFSFVEESDSSERLKSITLQLDEIITFSVVDSFNKGYLKIFCNGVDVKETNYPQDLIIRIPVNGHSAKGNDVSSVQLAPHLPKGKYRDLKDYYSIQNTFPEIYSIGPNAKTANASEFEIAQSRQLMGYLTLFDQVIANQFAQLARVGHIFSYKNEDTTLRKEEGIREHLNRGEDRLFMDFPVEFEDISSSYFFQSLYDIPNIRPILKHSDTFIFEDTIENSNRGRKQSWEAYKRDPYNPYIKGLHEYVEDEDVNISRRNDVLDHLLARNGVSPQWIDIILEGSLCTGNRKKDLIVYKSLYLQNLGLLSYYRAKSFNYIGADQLKKDVDSAQQKIDKIVQVNRSETVLFNPSYLYHIYKLQPSDFVNFSAIELKVNMLLGLTIQYLNFVRSNYESIDASVLNQVLWLLYERKGIIMIELNLVFRLTTSYRVMIQNADGVDYFRFVKRLRLDEYLDIKNTIEGITEARLFNSVENGQLLIGTKAYEVELLNISFKTLNKSKPVSLRIVNSRLNDQEYSEKSLEQIPYDVIFFLPDYIPQFREVSFEQRLSLFLDQELPLNLRSHYMPLSLEDLHLLIPAFVNFRNALIKNGVNADESTDLLDSADLLASLINDFVHKRNEG